MCVPPHTSVLHVLVSVQRESPPSSVSPLQLLSIPSHISGACLSPGTQLSTTAPLTHVVAPVEAQGPWPQVVVTD